MPTVPKAFPKEFREDVVRVARTSESSVAQVAKDVGISESCLHRWLAMDDVEAGKRSGVSASESAELRELRRRNKLLEQENEVLRRAAAYLSQANLPGSQGK
jgi:transposase-like protein